MEKERLQQYNTFANAVWQFFKKYPSGITEDNVFQAVPEANEMARDFCNIVGRYKIIEAVVLQLLEIGERERDGDDNGAERIDQTFKMCNQFPQLTHDISDAIMTWLGWLSDLYPEEYDRIVAGLGKLLRAHGMHFSDHELDAYIEAGWCISDRGCE